MNKTNQFNLNGERYTEAEWRQFLADPSAFLLTATYEDKYGALGKIAVLLGTIHGDNVQLRAWVMSCRAFSRRIEHQCLRFLFDELGAERISFEYSPTSRNGPMRDFLISIADTPLDASITLVKADYSAKAPQLFHRLKVSVHA